MGAGVARWLWLGQLGSAPPSFNNEEHNDAFVGHSQGMSRQVSRAAQRGWLARGEAWSFKGSH